jgi:uncharacterized protein (DUF924 family)
MNMDEREEVLGFWFGELSADGHADQAHAQRWWTHDPVFDAVVRQRFGALYAAVAAGEREDWLESARGALAYVIVLDQFSRNMFRDSPDMFAQDARALRAALSAIDRGFDRQLALGERGFLYMPLMHSEQLALQDRCVAHFTAFRDELAGAARARVASALDFAERHRAIVQRFGRFPHRNRALGRSSTPEELEFLTQPGSAF